MRKKCFVYTFFLLLSFALRADELLSNGKIVCYYEEASKALSSIRGDALYPMDIARLSLAYYQEEGNIYLPMEEGLERIEKEGRNLLKLYYRFGDKEVVLSVLPSYRSREVLYAKIEAKNCEGGYLVLDIEPAKKKGYLQRQGASFSYDRFHFQSSEEDSKLLLSAKAVFPNLQFQEVLARSKKAEDDRLYYLFPQCEEKEETLYFRIAFYYGGEKKEVLDATEWQAEVLAQEKEREKLQPLSSSENLLANLEYLDLLGSDIHIPEHLSYAKAKSSYKGKQQMLYLRAMYGLGDEDQRILEDMNLRKKEIDSVHYYYYALLYARTMKRGLDQDLVQQRLAPQILSMYDQMTEDGRLIVAEDSLGSYATYLALLKLLGERPEFAADHDFIRERQARLEGYIRKNFLEAGRLKWRRTSEEEEAKSMEYVMALPRKEALAVFQDYYQSAYDPKYGAFLESGATKMDMRHNLKMLSIMYQLGLWTAAESLFESLESYISGSQNYVLEYYPLEGESPDLEISSEAIYNYLEANWYREQYYGNER